PPTPPWEWHSAHDLALNTGPSPSPRAIGSFGAHSWRKSVSPTAFASTPARGALKTGTPGESPQATPSAVTPTAPNTIRRQFRKNADAIIVIPPKIRGRRPRGRRRGENYPAGH